MGPKSMTAPPRTLGDAPPREMAAVRPDCLPLPAAMLGRPVEPRGYPVPWFATAVDGAWDLRVVRPERWAEAVRRQVCWVSGRPLGRYRAFVIGPMCTVNRVSADPPVTREIALWSARVCPFLSRPLARRNERGFEELGVRLEDQPGVMLTRNPGVVAVWVTHARGYRVLPERLFRLEENPMEVTWFTEGRHATRAEVLGALVAGFPALRELAERDGPEAVALAERMLDAALQFLPEGRS